MIGVAAVANDSLGHAGQLIEQQNRTGQFMGLPRCQRKGDGVALPVGDHARLCAIIASSLVVTTVERGVFGPITAACTKERLRHFATVLGFSPCCAASSLGEAFDRGSAALTACVVVAQPCRTCPITPPGMKRPQLKR